MIDEAKVTLTFFQTVRAVCEAQDILIGELEDAVGVYHGWVATRERKARQGIAINPSLFTAMRIAEVLDRPLEALINGEAAIEAKIAQLEESLKANDEIRQRLWHDLQGLKQMKQEVGA